MQIVYTFTVDFADQESYHHWDKMLDDMAITTNKEIQKQNEYNQAVLIKEIPQKRHRILLDFKEDYAIPPEVF